MTIIAGAISRNGNKLPEWLCSGIIANLSRHPGDVVESHRGEQWLIAKLDVGALGCKGSFSVAGGPVFVMTGEPLIAGVESRSYKNREEEGKALFEDMCSDQETLLRASTGTFSGAYYSPQKHRLTLIADKLGLRPIYYLVTQEFAAFTSALRVFEAVGIGTTDVDLKGVYETCAFGFPLGDRTCYEVIRAIEPAEIVNVSSDATKHSRYFRWDLLEDASEDESVLIRRLVAKFDSAVKRRLREDKTTLSFLSGGLDSRAILAALRNCQSDVYTFNYAPPGTQDRVFGVLAAEALGAIHHQVDVPLSSASSVYRKDHLRHWVDASTGLTPRPERPSCIWSGDGGSVALGHVYLDPETIASLEKGNLELGIHSFLHYNRLPGASNSAMTPRFRKQTSQWHFDGVREQLNLLQRKIDGRALYLFLMFNDQRRHLAKHFEDIDIDRFEFHLPFFDSEFLETIIRAPVHLFLRHALYIKWLQAFNPIAASVPWQAYPNHIPCPIPYEGELRYQWGDYFGQKEERRLYRKQGKDALGRLFSGPFPNHLVSRTKLAMAISLSLLGSTSYSHLVRVGDTFNRYWQQSHSTSPKYTP